MVTKTNNEVMARLLKEAGVEVELHTLEEKVEKVSKPKEEKKEKPKKAAKAKK